MGDEWQTIESAPRDGTLIRVGWKEPEDAEMQEWFTMQWAHVQKNGLFPGVVGMWVEPTGAFTWNEADPAGAPTHWAPVSQGEGA